MLTRQQGKVDQTLASLFLALILSAGTALGKEQENSLASDAAVKKAIIADSLSRYPGPCPCPYNVARNGSRCGKRSAYSRPGGYSPVCYESDVTSEMVKEWRKEKGAGLPKR